MTDKERNLIKGAIRRVFSRSETRCKVLNSSIIEHVDVERPRVKKWGRCESCQKIEALYQLEVDHKVPVVPKESSLKEMSWDTLVNNVFCDESNLAVICKFCHRQKSKEENKKRREFKKCLSK